MSAEEHSKKRGTASAMAFGFKEHQGSLRVLNLGSKKVTMEMSS